jgi:threonyl-tRNA synthetase
MNCPMHCLIFRSRQRSYRELPLRLFELGTVYRYERAGTLHGLMRIRGFTQDDSHIFCTEEQMADEVASSARLRAVGAAGLRLRRVHVQPVDEGPGQVRRRRRDLGRRHRGAAPGARRPRPRLRRQGGRRRVLRTQDRHRRARRHRAVVAAVDDPGRLQPARAVRPRVRRRRQRPPPPIMLHRALFGSVERFFGVLVEHYAGAFPTWLAPVQVRVLPVPRRTRPTPSRWPPAAGRRGFRVDDVWPTTSSASASAPPSSRSCPTCSWWATTTSPPAPSASTRAAARSSATCRSRSSSPGSRDEVAEAESMALGR